MEIDNEKLNSLIPSEIPKALALFTEITNELQNCIKVSSTLQQRVQNSKSTHKGISFLEAKYHTMLSYLVNLTHIFMMKLSGDSIDGAQSVDRLIEYRIVLERMRPVDQKLKYQIDKLLKIVSVGTIDVNDPLHFKANPDDMVNKLEKEGSDDSQDESGEDQKKGGSKGLYVPPKLAAMHYDGDEQVEDKQKQMLDLARKKALSSSILEDLRREYYDGPEEIKESVNTQKRKIEKNTQDRIRYEEDNFVRLNVTKKEKNAHKKLSTMSSLNNLTRFEDISVLDETDASKIQQKTQKKRSNTKGSFKAKKGSKKRRRYH